MNVVTPFPLRRGQPQVTAFNRPELMRILDLYGRMVAAGHWRDYAMHFDRDVEPGATMVGIPARPVDVESIHYSPGFIPYGTPCGEDSDPAGAGFAALEQEVAMLRQEIEAMKAAQSPASRKKSA